MNTRLLIISAVLLFASTTGLAASAEAGNCVGWGNDEEGCLGYWYEDSVLGTKYSCLGSHGERCVGVQL